jgi:hypothetical protein
LAIPLLSHLKQIDCSEKLAELGETIVARIGRPLIGKMRANRTAMPATDENKLNSACARWWHFVLSAAERLA